MNATSERDLAAMDCKACRGDVPALTMPQISDYLKQLAGWSTNDKMHFFKEFKFKNFIEALKWVNRVGELAERQGHHPDIHLAWGKVGVEIWTHKINGLTEADAILAAKINALQ